MLHYQPYGIQSPVHANQDTQPSQATTVPTTQSSDSNQDFSQWLQLSSPTELSPITPSHHAPPPQHSYVDHAYTPHAPSYVYPPQIQPTLPVMDYSQNQYNFYLYPSPDHLQQSPQLPIGAQTSQFFTPPKDHHQTQQHIMTTPDMYHFAGVAGSSQASPALFTTPVDMPLGLSQPNNQPIYPDSNSPILRRTSNPAPPPPPAAPGRTFRPSRLRNVSNFDPELEETQRMPTFVERLEHHDPSLSPISAHRPPEPQSSESSLAFALASPIKFNDPKKPPPPSPVTPQNVPPATTTPSGLFAPPIPNTKVVPTPLIIPGVSIVVPTVPKLEETPATPATPPGPSGANGDTNAQAATELSPLTPLSELPETPLKVPVPLEAPAPLAAVPPSAAPSSVSLALATIVSRDSKGKRRRGSRTASPAVRPRALGLSAPASRSPSRTPTPGPRPALRKRFAPSPIAFWTGPVCEDAVEAHALAHRYRTRSRLRSIHDELEERERERDLFLIRGGVFDEVTNVRGGSGSAAAGPSRKPSPPSSERWMLTRSKNSALSGRAKHDSHPGSRATSVVRGRTSTPGPAGPTGPTRPSPSKHTIKIPGGRATPGGTPSGTPAPRAKESTPAPNGVSSASAPAAAVARPIRELPKRATRPSGAGALLDPADWPTQRRADAQEKANSRAGGRDGTRAASAVKTAVDPAGGLAPSDAESQPAKTKRGRPRKDNADDGADESDAAVARNKAARAAAISSPLTPASSATASPQKSPTAALKERIDKAAQLDLEYEHFSVGPAPADARDALKFVKENQERKKRTTVDEADGAAPSRSAKRRRGATAAGTPDLTQGAAKDVDKPNGAAKDKGKGREVGASTTTRGSKRKRALSDYEDDDGDSLYEEEAERGAGAGSRRAPRKGFGVPIFSTQPAPSTSAVTLDHPTDGPPPPGIVRDAAGRLVSRTFPSSLPIRREEFPLWYRRFPLPASWRPYDPVGDFVLGTTARVKAPAGGQANNPTSAYDLYTPRFVKGSGREKQGLCPLCYELPARGGEGRQNWFAMKVSAYNYHMQNAHGISASSKLPMSPPIEFHTAKRTVGGKHEKDSILEGKCHQCQRWIPLEGIKLGEIKVKEIYWWKHAAKCHMSVVEGESDVYVEDMYLARLKAYEANRPAATTSRTSEVVPATPAAPIASVAPTAAQPQMMLPVQGQLWLQAASLAAPATMQTSFRLVPITQPNFHAQAPPANRSDAPMTVEAAIAASSSEPPNMSPIGQKRTFGSPVDGPTQSEAGVDSSIPLVHEATDGEGSTYSPTARFENAAPVADTHMPPVGAVAMVTKDFAVAAPAAQSGHDSEDDAPGSPEP